MKIVQIIFLLVIANPLWAGCEATIIQGSHTAIKKSEAKAGAWEEAKDACYPGEASKLSIQCKNVGKEKGVQGKAAKRCIQDVSCNICGDDLTRKYEALQ